MRYATFTENTESSYDIALLVPMISKKEIQRAYFSTDLGVPIEDVLVLELHTAGKKTPVSQVKAFINEMLVETLVDMKVKYVFCANGEYFKALAGVSKIEPNMGYVLDSPYGDFKVTYMPNFQAMFYDPEKIQSQISQAMTAVSSHLTGNYQAPGASIIKTAHYPKTYQEIEAALEELLALECPLTIDIETFSLKHPTAGIGTISFCLNQGEGLAFAVDYDPIPGVTSAPFGRQVKNGPVRRLLRNFFERYLQKQIYHSISFDVYVLIYQLFMEDLLDTEGLLHGLEVMLRNWDCTKLITYLATNSCAGNDLSLKGNSQEFAGNWAKDTIEDITTIPLDELLEYNLVDGLATWYVHDKYRQTVIDDEQEEIYQTIFKPAMLDIIQMQLTGLPIDMDRVKEVKKILQADEKAALDTIMQSQLVQGFTHHLKEEHVRARNAELKKKQITLADAECDAIVFNPNSPPQLQKLLYAAIGLPIIARTDSNLPSTDQDTVKDLRNHTTNPEVLALLNALLDYKAVNKILTAFIPAFENATLAPDGWHYLFGNFNLGGTLSGRLSSSDPNLQNLPATKSKYAKIIKSCFAAPPGWIFGGLDFDSLEDKISALTTKDPQKLKVYTDGYDGHCLRAYAYFGDNMPDIDPNSVVSINSIAKLYGDERQESKVPTFALTYQGTFNTLMVKCGFSKEKAKLIESRYHDLYQVSDAWVAAHIEQATKVGYVTAAFGLRVRTPLLKQVVLGTQKTPYEATAEGRSAGNALGQSWCLLNNRAASEFMGKVRRSNYRTDIRPTAHIHDAQYYLIRDSIDAVKFTNEHLVKAVAWQEHPLIAHDEVKLSGGLSLFYPNWSKEISIPAEANDNQIMECIMKAVG